MKKTNMRLLSLLLALAVLFTAIPLTAAADDAAVGATLRAQAEGAFLVPDKAEQIPAGLAAKYGYANAASVTGVSGLDALVRAHELLFGEMFAPETASELLAVNGGSISRVFGMDTYNFGYTINGVQPHGGVWTEGGGGYPGYYNAYAINEVELKDNDVVEFFIYRDSMGLDLYSWFEQDGTKVESLSLGEGEDLTLTLRGYSIGWYGASDTATIEAKTEEVTEAQLALVDEYGNITDLDGVLTDDNGVVTLSFDKPGRYTVSAYITDEDITEYYVTPIIMPHLTVEVREKSEAEKAEADLALLFAEFDGTYTSAAPLAFPYGTEAGQFTNALEFIKRKALELLPHRSADEITIEANTTTLPGTSGAGTALEAKTMDAMGNITPVYSEGPTKPALMNLQFRIGGQKSEKIRTLYLSVEPRAADADKQAELEASAITWDSVRGKNTAPDYITQSLGKLTGTTVGALSNTPAVYKNGVTITWSLAQISGTEGALTLGSDRKTSVLRPNVGETDAKYRLTATVTSKQDPAAVHTTDFDLSVPAFADAAVPFDVSPADAVLEVTDSYYKQPVDSKYIQIEEDGARRIYTLHASATDGAQKYDYTLSKPGYITKTGSISVTGTVETPVSLTLSASSEDDNKLKALAITNPAPGAASIKAPMDAFDAEVEAYSLTVGALDYITLAPSAFVEEATVSVARYSSASNANKGTSTNTVVSAGKTTNCYLKTDGTPTVITITVTAPEGSVQTEKTKTYTLTVTRTDEEHTLKGLALTTKSEEQGGRNGRAIPEEETLLPALDKGGIEDVYTYYVNHFCTSVQVKPTAVDAASVKSITVNGETVASGQNSGAIALAPGNNPVSVVVTKQDDTIETYHLIVRRKQDAILNGYTVEGSAPTTGIAKWVSSANFPASAQEVTMTFDAPEGSAISVEGVEGAYAPGEAVRVPVGSSNSKMLAVSVSKEFEENGTAYTDNHVYIIGLYRMAADSPSSVASYLPAPGQFVNQDIYKNPEKTLAGPMGGGVVTLGSYGGSIVYYFEEAITNDDKNPYGVDFIVYGNAFTNADGSSSASAAEPASVLVSEDGETWYELAGSLYYDANTRHNVSVTYTNPDPAFAGAVDIGWIDSDGNAGVLAKNAFHSQPYYPDPAYYGAYNTGAGKNESYTAETMTVTGSVLSAAAFPAFGYADTHAAANPASNTAVNPYRAAHEKAANGDGMDLAWAVDANGNHAAVDKVHYVKISSASLVTGSTGEISPEITGILRAKGEAQSVGKTPDLTALSINGEELALTDGAYAYEFDTKGAASVSVCAVGGAEDNIYVNDTYVPSGVATPQILAGDKLRVIAQNGTKEPVLYTITLTGAGESDAIADLAAVSVIPGDIDAEADGDMEYSVTVPNSVGNVRVRALPLNTKAVVTVQDEAVSADSDWVSAKNIALAAGKTTTVPITVTSPDGTTVKEYTLSVTRESSGSGEGTGGNTIRVKFSLIGDSKHGTAEAHKSFETWIASKTYQIPKGSKVKYLTDMALIEAGLPFKVDAKGSYITEINGLGEFDNGPLSGWMYKLNGTHEDVSGYASQTLSDGDAVVWHFSDDYTKEDGGTGEGGNGGGSSGGSSGNTDDTASVVSGTTISPKVTAKNGVASFTAASKYIAAALKNAKATDRVTVAPQVSGNVESVAVTIVQKDVASLAKDTAGLWLKTGLGSIVVPKASLSALPGGDLTLQISKKADGSVSYTLTCGGKAVESLAGGMLVSLPASKGDVPALVGDDGETEAIKKSAVVDGTAWALLRTPGQVTLVPYDEVFEDTASHWGRDDIAFAAGRGLFLGVDDTHFDPDGAMTRAMFVTALHRLEGSPKASGAPFDDVAADAWFAEASIWATQQGIVNGTGSGFSPNENITREQLAAMICRYAAYLGIDTAATGGLDKFIDSASVSDWAKAPVAWCVENGVLTGKGDGRLDPDGDASRAEVAAILGRLVKLMLK